METTNFELTRFLLNSVNNAQEEAVNHKDYNILKNNFHLFSEKNKYIMNTFRYYNNIVDFNDDIKKVEIFLRRFPNSKFLNENDIDNLTYIKYHMEVLFHKIHTILELKKLMINEVYKVGFSEKECTWENLKKHSKLRSKVPMQILDNYFKTFKHIIDLRHLNTHRGHYNDEKSIDISASLNIYKWAEKDGYNLGENFKLMMPKFLIEYKLREFKKERVKFVKNASIATIYYKEEFFKYLLIDFKNNIENWK
ncbi:Cthe_2314 family HEPN domain-containing protein [Flavobacterium degerlachei]|uniref:Uncharacterized protein n=1 Tax=Flavobacterium degerlachei TaxID=229203 RepID=A0A1H3EBA8_9FLAO|nr:Cthe_2314 family HEPN domain-containing protein [Flavobacterium degerlachei]SDX75890.1 hypothetical protein SAMN05444338_11497 [Flavobacterium degerlachei]